jgi:hypothetical protein
VLRLLEALRNLCSETSGSMACASSGIKKFLSLMKAYALAELNSALVARGDNGLAN